jgi:hypothetical protein
MNTQVDKNSSTFIDPQRLIVASTLADVKLVSPVESSLQPYILFL